MKTLLKWNYLFALLMMCSVPLFMSCGDDDDPTDPDNPGNVTGEYIGWKDSGNTATFGYKTSAAGVSVTTMVKLTFDGSGDNAKCTKCTIEETYPSDAIASAAETALKNYPEDYKNIKRNGKKVTYDDNSFIGDTRKNIRTSLERAFGNK